MMTTYLPESKTCPACGAMKPRSEWSLNRTQADGLAGHCKACSADYKREYRKRMSQRRLEWVKAQAATATVEATAP